IVLAPGKRTRGGFMHHCGSDFRPTLAIIVFGFVLALSGCLGKSTGNPGAGGVATVTLSPGESISIDVGATQIFSASGRDANGRPVLGLNIQYVVTVPPGVTTGAPLSVASNGNACAGTWDATIAICNPGTPGVAVVSAVINGISSPSTYVYVHQHIDSIQIVNAVGQPPQYVCFSQGQTWQYAGIAYSGNPPVDISNTVGPINWSSTIAGVVTTTLYVPPNQTTVMNQVQTTAASPGITQIFASVSGTTSAPFPYTTCLVKAIYLQIAAQGQTGNSITVDTGTAVSVTATAVDTLYGIANSAPLSKPPLTWSTTNPEVAAFSSLTTTTGTNSAATRANLGGATVFASCTPPTCNIGVTPGLPIYASEGVLPNGTQGYGSIAIDVTTTTQPPTYSAWAATTDCGGQPGCSSALFEITPQPNQNNPIGFIASLPRTPNSMMFNHVSSPRIYFGTNQGLIYVDVTSKSPSATLISNSPTPCNVSLCGTVLTISNDGKLVVVSDNISTPSQVYIYNGGTTTNTAPIDLILSNSGEIATAAAFSPDQSKVFILTNLGNMYVYSTVDALSSVPVATSATDIEFSADGSFAYVAGTPATSVTGFSTCSVPGAVSAEIGSVTASSTPLKIFPSPLLPPVQAGSDFVTQSVIALEPPNVELLTAEFAQVPIPYKDPLQLTCNPPTMLSFVKGASYNLGQGNFTPIYTQLVNDGTQLIVVAQNIPAVLLFNIANGTTTSVGLSRAGYSTTFPLAASASTDGSQVFVAACDQYQGTACTAGSVHIVNTISGGDFQQVPYVNVNQDNNPNMCNGQGVGAPLCLPNLVAIRPQ
ncbi:MAG: hypothetical protein WBQ39_19010, partial [Terriglobales bacterium]